MKRVYFSLAILTLIYASVTGQSLILSQDSTVISGSASKFEHIANTTITNNSSNPVDVEWLRFINDIPSEWESAVCDGNGCYQEDQDYPPVPYTIQPGAAMTFDIHFWPNNVAGTGTVKVKAWIVGDSSTAVTGTYKLTTESVSSAPALQDNNKKIRIYPNPARDYILMKNLPEKSAVTVEIYNIFGRRMLSFSQAPGNINADGVQKFDINTLAKGIYMIRVFDANMNVIYTESLSKE